jgi:hypothetical protein
MVRQNNKIGRSDEMKHTVNVMYNNAPIFYEDLDIQLINAIFACNQIYIKGRAYTITGKMFFDNGEFEIYVK